MEKAIADEAAKEKEVGPFSFIRTDVKGLIFVEIRIAEICPMLLCEDYIRKVAASRQAKTKYAVRLTPVSLSHHENSYDEIKSVCATSTHERHTPVSRAPYVFRMMIL